MASLLILSFLFFASAVTPAPDWTKDLVIYEVNPRGFTSPDGTGDGSGSGTFESLRLKLPYLEKLGVTGIWMAGYCLAEVHFYNIWTVYANIEPDVLDPKLGSEEEFASLIKEAHSHGIHIFLDVITHGVTNDSSLIKKHPHWFNGSSWRMTDYTYDDPGFLSWWIEVWTNYVTKYGVDGYRLDGPNGVAPAEKVLAVWDNITEQCAAMGHPIVVFPEGARYHFSQRNDNMGIFGRSNMAKSFSPSPQYEGIQISCHDNGWEEPPGNYYAVHRSRATLGYAALFAYNLPLWFGGEEFDADPLSLPDLQRELYGGGGPGGWLYGTYLDWNQTEAPGPGGAAMLSDVSAMLGIRKAHCDVLHGDRSTAHIIEIPSQPEAVLVPYGRYDPGAKAIIVAANNDTSTALELQLTLPLKDFGMDGYSTFKLLDLWQGGDEKVVSKEDLASLKVVIPADCQSGGGLAVLSLVPHNQEQMT